MTARQTDMLSSMDVCLFKLIALGLLVVCCGSSRSKNTHEYVTEDITKQHKVLEESLGLADPAVGLSPLFSFIHSLFPFQSEQKMAMNATLNVYKKLFSSLLAQEPPLLEGVSSDARHNVNKALKTLEHQLLELTKHFYQESSTLKMVLSSLGSIQVDDISVQKKALAEFKTVFQAASVVANCDHGNSPVPK